MPLRLVAFGQAAAGDDGVGAAIVREVVAALQARGRADAVQVHLVDPSGFVALLAAGPPIILVDAVLGAPAGQVLELDPEALAARPSVRVSSHGMGVAEALALAKVLNRGEAEAAKERPAPELRIVAVTIAQPARWHVGLSAEVEAAVAPAVGAVLALCAEFAARRFE